jgi:biotin/methionine sulfoxide reductase
MDSGPVSARGKVAGREAILINPADAALRGIAEGCVVRVHNRRGACLAGAVVTDAVRPGVVQLSCGAWYDPADDTADALCRHGNANVLTRDHGTSKLAQGPSSATTTVEIECYTAAAPPVGAFIPPLVSQRP